MHNTRTQGLAVPVADGAFTALWSEGVIRESQADGRPEHFDCSEKQWQRIENAFNFHGNVVGRIRHGVLKMADSIAQRAAATGLCEVVLPRNYLVLQVSQIPYLFKCDAAHNPRFVLTQGKTGDTPWPGGVSPMNSTEMCEVARDLAEGWLSDLAIFLEQRCILVESLDSLLALETSLASLSAAAVSGVPLVLEPLPNARDAGDTASSMLAADLAPQTLKRRKALSELGRSTGNLPEARDAAYEQPARRMTLRDLGRGTRDSRDGRGAMAAEPERRLATG